MMNMMMWEIGKNYKKVVLLTQNKKKNTLPKKNDTSTDHTKCVNIKAVSRTNKNIKDHHEDCLNENRIISA